MMLKQIIKSLIISSGSLKLLHRFKGPSITILRYHSVQETPSDYEDTIGASIIHSTEEFRKQMKILSDCYNPVTMDEVLDFLENGAVLPPHPVVVTFDDGFKDNLSTAMPIMAEYNIPAMFYVITDAIEEQGNKSPWFMRVRRAFGVTEQPSWTDADNKTYSLTDKKQRLQARRAAMAYCGSSIGDVQLERAAEVEKALNVPYFAEGLDMMLSWDDTSELRRAGHTIGSHTLSHPNMAYVSEPDATEEFKQSKVAIESRQDEIVKHFAYPNPILDPNWNESTCRLSKQAGYKTAVTCNIGCVKLGDDPYSLKRMFTPLDHKDLRWCIENTMNGFDL